ncbi:MAG: VTT domain-containing protein [Candidatus Gracilibacteria bacterium]|nr:VTT domain-containing protein [Candidatus Gracilibacteria bacterium]
MNISIISFFQDNHYLFLAIIPFLGQLRIPIGTAFFILFAGALISNFGDFAILFSISLLSSIIGDIAAYMLGKKFFYINFIQKQLKKEHIKKVFSKTENYFNEKGKSTIFITRFLITGLGPYMNYIVGLQSYNFKIFIKFALLGEILYVLELLLLGYLFKDTFEFVADILYYLGIILILAFSLFYIAKIIIKKNHKILSEK